MAEPRDVSGWPSLQARPCRYPDPPPAAERRPYVYRGGCVFPLQRGRATTPGGLRVDSAEGPQPLRDWLRALGAAPLEERIPVLALGANAYPPQLREKLRSAPRPLQDDTVPVLGCVLRDANLVFCAHLSRAGYIPVTARHRPGHAVAAWLQWFTAAQLPLIAAAEGPRYRLVEIAQGGGALTLEGVATRPPRAYTWLHDALLDFGAGPLAFAGAPPSGHAPDPAGRLEVDLLREADRPLRPRRRSHRRLGRLPRPPRPARRPQAVSPGAQRAQSPRAAVDRRRHHGAGLGGAAARRRLRAGARLTTAPPLSAGRRPAHPRTMLKSARMHPLIPTPHRPAAGPAARRARRSLHARPRPPEGEGGWPAREDPAPW